MIFCVGRLIQLEDCKKYGVKVTTTSSLEKYLDLTFREEAVNEIVQRTQEKYRDKIESLKSPKAKQNWAIKYHRAFEPYLSYMSDNAKNEARRVQRRIIRADGNINKHRRPFV